MQIITQGRTASPGVFERAWMQLTTLKFISNFFNWLFLLFGRIAEPLMFIAVAYVLTHQARPDAVAFMDRWASPASLITLNAAPEAVLPSCFIQAKHARGHDDLAFRLNFGMGLVFLALTLITLASFVWKWDASVEVFILFLRCAASVMYTVLVRVFSTNEHDVHTVKADQVQQMYTEISEQFRVHIEAMRKEFSVHLVNMRRELTQELTRSQTVHIDELRQEMYTRLEESVQTILSEQPVQIEPPTIDLTTIRRQVTITVEETVKEVMEPYVAIMEAATMPQLPAVKPQQALPSQSSASAQTPPPASTPPPATDFNKTAFINEQLDLAEAEHREIKNSEIIALAREQHGVEILRSQVSNIRTSRRTHTPVMNISE